MSVYLCGELDAAEREAWLAQLREALPGERVADTLAGLDPAAVDVAVVANPAPGSLRGLPGLRLIQSLWAGVDRLLADPTLPAGVPLARMVDPAMNAAMAETALWAALALQRGFFAYARQQRESLWQPLPQRRADEWRVTVLGRGQMGGAVAARLAAQGYALRVWHREAGPLAAALAGADAVFNLLPLTPATRGLLDAAAFAAMKPGAALVNLARGAHVVEADLLAALDAGRLAHAVLDVFAHEPLPAGHRFWAHPRVTVLPHAAAQTDPRSAAAVVAANVQALRAGRPLAHRVDRSLGY
ncbi:MAG: glyoxylate/hydroxypyruvate reductase A [Burkholderiaceae bacterium]